MLAQLLPRSVAPLRSVEAAPETVDKHVFEAVIVPPPHRHTLPLGKPSGWVDPVANGGALPR